jgi:DNA-binding MarR family transcriptional regulator
VCLSAKGRSVLRLMRASNQSLEREWEAAIDPERLAALRQIVSDLLNQAA